MPGKTPTIEERVGRIGQRRQVVIPRDLAETLNLQQGDLVAFRRQGRGVLIQPKRLVDPDDTLTREEAAVVAWARQEMRQGKYVSLARIEHELARQHPPRRRGTA